MSERFEPIIKEAQDVSGSIAAAEALHSSQDERSKMLNEHIGAGKSGTIVTREGKNDLWIRKEKGGVLKGVDAMIPGSTINVLKAEYKVDAKDGQPKLYYYCEIDNAATVNGGKSGTDKGWIYAGYIHIPSGSTPIPGKEEPKPTPIPGKEEPKPTPIPGKEEPKPTPIPGKEEPKPTPIPGKEEPKPTPIPGKEEPKPTSTETGGRTVPVVGGGKNETFVDPPRAEGTAQVFDEKSVLENLKQDVNVQKRLPKFLLVSQVANTFIQGLRSNPSSHGNKPDQAARLEQKVGAIMKELTKLGSKLSTEVPDYSKIEDKLLSLEKDMGPIFGEGEVKEIIQHLELVQNEIPLVTNGGIQAPGEVPEWIERKIGSNMRKYILGANGNSGLAMEFMANRLIKRRDVAGTNPKMEQLRTELRNADGAIFNMLETKGWSAVNDYLYNTLKSIGVSDSANDTFRKEAKKAVDSINQQYNDNAPALKAEFKKELLAKGVANDANLDGKVLVLFEAKKNDSVSKAVASQLTTKAIRHKADSDGDANNSQLIAEIDSASEDGWVLIGSQIAIDIGTILATGGVAGALGKLAARGVTAAVEYTTLATRAARVSRGLVLGSELATSGAVIGGALQIEHNAFDHRDVFADILPAAGWGAAFGVVNGVVSTLGNGAIRGGIARVSGLGAGPGGRLAAGAVAPWSEESFRAMWALSKSNALSKGINVAAWGAREASIVYASMGVIEYAQSKASDREWHGMTLEEFGPALIMHFVLKNYGDKSPYERAQQKVRDLYKEIQTLKGSDNASAYKSQIDALQKAHDYMSRQLEVTDHLNTIPNPPITTKPEDPDGPKPEPKVETSPFMSAKERMTHVKPGETVLVTGKDGATMEITVKTNNNGILEGTAKSTEADGTINPEIPVKMNIRSDGLLVVKNMDGTPYKGLVIKKLSDIAEIEVRPAANKAKEKPKTEEPALKEKFATTEKAADHAKMRELEGKISDLKSQIVEAGKPGTENGNTKKQVELNDVQRSLIAELNALRGKYGVPDYGRAPNWASNLTLNEFSAGVEKNVPAKKTQEKPKTEEPALKEKFATTEKAADHAKMRELEGKISDLKSQIVEAGKPGTENGNTKKQVELNDVQRSLIVELNALRGKYGVPDYGRAPNWASNLTLNEFSAGVEKNVPAKKTQEKPKTEEPAPKGKPTELTERQRLQKENAEANTEFDRLVNSSEKVDPKALEAARTRKRETAAALEKHLSSETTAKTKEPEAPKTEPKKAPEAQKIAPEVSQEMAYNVRNYLKGKGSFEHLRDANGRQNGPNSIDLGNGVTLTRSIEGGLLNGTKVRMGGKEVFEIKRGDKVEKVSGEELGQKLTEKEWSNLNTKISSMNLRAGEKTITLLKDGTMKIEYSDGSTLTAKPGDNRRSTFVEGFHTNKSGTIEAKGSFDGLGRLENGTVTITENGTKTTYKTVDKKTNYEQATSFTVDNTTYTLKQVSADGTQEFTRNSNGKETTLTLNKGEKINARAPEIVGRRVKAALDGVKPVKMGKNTEIRTADIDGVTHARVVQTGFAGDKVQTFEGTRSGDTYTGTLTRNDGRVLEGSFKIQDTVDKGHLDMVNA